MKSVTSSGEVMKYANTISYYPRQVKPGDLVRLQRQYVTTLLVSLTGDDRDSSTVGETDMMLFLCEEEIPNRPGTCWGKVFHCPTGQLGYVRLDRLCQVK